MSRIKGFQPPPRTLPTEALASRLLMDNARLRKALIRIIEASKLGTPHAAIRQLAEEGLQRLNV